MLTISRCKSCSRRDCFYRNGLCNICRRPKAVQQLLRAGIPFMTADGLLRLMKAARNQTHISVSEVLNICHPIVMGNVKIRSNQLVLIDKSLMWVRRTGWTKGTKAKYFKHKLP